jgi:site-specific recombinase XerD
MMATRKWTKTKYPGIRYREHLTRKHGVKFDRYYAFAYKHEGKTISEGFGWSSEGANLDDAAAVYGELRLNRKNNIRPFTLAEKRQMEAEKRQEEDAAAAAIAKDEETKTLSVLDTVFETYTSANSHKKSLGTEKGLYTNWLQPVIGKKRLDEIISLDLERVKSTMLKDGKSPRTVQYTFAVLRQIFNHAVDAGLFAGSMPRVKVPKFNNQRQRFLSVDEANNLLEKLKTKSMTSYRISLLSLYCALRFGEIAALKWQHINLTDRLITMVDTKNTDSRSAYMPDAVFNMFTEMEEGKPGDLVFPTKDGNTMSQISDSFMDAVDDLKLNEGVTDRKMKVVFHTLRHSCASHLVMTGVDLTTVQSILGHKTLAMTNRYSHLSPAHKKAAMTSMDTVMKPKKQRTKKHAF